MKKNRTRKKRVLAGVFLMILAALLLVSVYIIVRPHDEPTYGDALFVLNGEGRGWPFSM